MELTESIDSINRQLAELFGVDTVTGQPIWRVVWAPDQTEKRLVDCTPEGWTLLVPEVREMKKYPWIKDQHILERLVVVPEYQQKELAGAKISYECIFRFWDKNENPLPPRVDVCQFVINTVYAAQGKFAMQRYVDDFSQYTPEAREKKISELVEYLWDTSDNADAIVHGQGIVVPHTYNDTKES